MTKKFDGSQLDYLHKRSNDYRHKYACVAEVLKTLKNVKTVGEYFAGIGIYTKYIIKYLKPDLIKAYDNDPKAIKIFKGINKNIVIDNVDFFENNDFDFDLLILDINSGTINTIEKIERVFKTKKQILLTDTGVFGLQYPNFLKKLSVKKLTPEIYFKMFNDKIGKKYGYGIKTVSYWHKNSVMHLVPKIVKKPNIIKTVSLEDWEGVFKNNKNYNSPRVSSQFVFCPFPFVLDSYAGCPQNCKYCFAYWNSLVNIAQKNKDFEDDQKTINPDHLERILQKKPRNNVEKELVGFIERKIPIHWGGVSEPFSCFEKEHGTGLKILKLLKKYQYPFIVSTKNSRIVEGEYWETLKGCKQKVIQVSLISLRPEMNKIETHPEIRVENRLKIIKKCAGEGMRVVVRIQPFIPIFCEKGLEDLIKKVSGLGAKAITIEYLKIMTMQMPAVKRVIRDLSEILGYDIMAFYNKFGRKTATDYELTPEFKKIWILKAKELAKKYGLEFYCADNEFRYLGDNPICCGVGNEKGFQKNNKTRTGRIFEINKDIIHIEDIIEDEELLKGMGRHWMNAGTAYNGSKNKNQSLLDVFRIAWNNPASPLSPCKFYTGVEYLGKDKNGNAVYKKNIK